MTMSRYSFRFSGLLGLFVALMMLTACSMDKPPRKPYDLPSLVTKDPLFKAAEKSNDAKVLLSKEELLLLEEVLNPPYTIGSGDVLRVDVYGRPEIGGRHVVGPDGKISVPLAGVLNLSEISREDAQEAIKKRLNKFFTHPYVSVSIDEYTSNMVTVLGRVERAGAQKFSYAPTLVEVLASAGAMPILDKQATLTRAAIMRGRNKMIWVDLKSLLNGDVSYNMRMKKGDIVFIPDSSDTAVYVMGQVQKPGSYRLTPRMSLLDVLAQAGGPNDNAAPESIGLYRSGAKEVVIIPFAALIDPTRVVNYALEDGDVIFVPSSGLADFGYFMRQISPFFTLLFIQPSNL
jgi:polysaccharide export outer membrane protein